jgi:hypothetical protein
VTAHFGGNHIAATTRLHAFAREVIAGALILLIAAVAGWLGGILTGGF